MLVFTIFNFSLWQRWKSSRSYDHANLFWIPILFLTNIQFILLLFLSSCFPGLLGSSFSFFRPPTRLQTPDHSFYIFDNLNCFDLQLAISKLYFNFCWFCLSTLLTKTEYNIDNWLLLCLQSQDTCISWQFPSLFFFLRVGWLLLYLLVSNFLVFLLSMTQMVLLSEVLLGLELDWNLDYYPFHFKPAKLDSQTDGMNLSLPLIIDWLFYWLQ